VQRAPDALAHGAARPVAAHHMASLDRLDLSFVHGIEALEPKRGIAPVPESRRLFPRMTVLENLEMGALAYYRVWLSPRNLMSL
jgi:hypothetical protein